MGSAEARQKSPGLLLVAWAFAQRRSAEQDADWDQVAWYLLLLVMSLLCYDRLLKYGQISQYAQASLLGACKHTHFF